MFYQNPFFFDYPKNQYMSSVLAYQPESNDDPRLVLSPYQSKYQQNHELLREELKLTVKTTISFVALNQYLYFPAEPKR